jgi:hypothetical protein
MPDWAPTTADVAAELPERVKDQLGNTAEDFDEDSVPTAEQVERIIEGAVRDTVAAVGTLESCDADNVADLRDGAKDVATLRAAMRVERTYFPDQLGGDLSAYNAIRDELKDKLSTLVEAVAESCGGGDGSSVGGPTQEPDYAFPEAIPWGGAEW